MSGSVSSRNGSGYEMSAGGTPHVTYELTLHDGRILRTRISHPVDRTTYGAGMWSHILRDQLDVSEGEFRDCVLEGRVPARGDPGGAKGGAAGGPGALADRC